MDSTLIPLDQLDPHRVIVYERYVFIEFNPDKDGMGPYDTFRNERIIGMLSATDPTKYHPYESFNQFTTDLLDLPSEADGWKPFVHLWENFDTNYYSEDDNAETAQKYKEEYYCEKMIPTICDPNQDAFVPSDQKISELYPTYQMYKTEDNGGVGFIVFVKDKEVLIYGRPEGAVVVEDVGVETEDMDNDDEYMMTKLFQHYQAKEVFIGKSTYNEMSAYSGAHGDKWDGNSLLILIQSDLSMSAYTYVFVGGSIVEFTTDELIVDFVSTVGNNRVPYPYAVSKNYVYCMSNFVKSPISYYEDRHKTGHVFDRSDAMVPFEKMDIQELSARGSWTFRYAPNADRHCYRHSIPSKSKLDSNCILF